MQLKIVRACCYSVDTSDLAVKRDCIVSKAEAGKLEINKLTNVSTSLNNLKKNVDDSFVSKLTTVPAGLKN